MIEAAVHAAAVPPFHAMAMSRYTSEREATGQRVLHLEVGQPSTPLPRLARDAVEDALEHPLGYTTAPGLHQLRQRLADRYAHVEPSRVLVVGGASAGFTLAFLTLFEQGHASVSSSPAILATATRSSRWGSRRSRSQSATTLGGRRRPS